MVNRLFELAKLGASEYPVHPEPLPLRQTVDAILADCDREGLTLDSTAVGDSTVTADRKLLGRILHNLIDNSCKYGATAPRCKSTQPDDLADLGPDAWLTVRHRQWPASLATPRPALSMATFQPVGFVLGATVLPALEGAKMMMERKEQPGVPIVKEAKQA